MKTVFMFLLFWIVVAVVPAGAEWVLIHQFPESGYINDIWVCSEDSVYAGMSTGQLYHWDGQTWTEEYCPAQESINDVHGVDDGFLVVSAGKMFYWRDNGVWHEIRLISQERHASITGNSREEFYISVDDQIRHYQNGQWIKILTPTSANPPTGFESIHLTCENILYVVGITYSCGWYQVPFTGMWIYQCWPNAPSCYRRNGDQLEPFLNTGTNESGQIVGAYSMEDLYIRNDYNHGFGSGGRITHNNGEFFTVTAQAPHSGYVPIKSVQANNLFFSYQAELIAWEGLIPRRMPILPNFHSFGGHLDGLSQTDFWISGSNRTIHHWVGPLPEVPAATGAFLKMDDYRVHAGELFRLQLATGNATDAVLTGDVYVCMMIFGMNGLWFWPNWTKDQYQIEPVRVTLEPHSFQYFDVFDLTWPEIDAEFDGLFHSIMVTDDGDISECQSIGFSVR